MINIADALNRNAWRDPAARACVDPATGRTLTHAQLLQRASALAVGLRGRLGLVRGDRVAILAHNTAEYLEIIYAAARCGLIALPLNWRLSAPELARVIADAEPKALIHSASFGEVASELQRSVDIPHWFAFDAGSASPYEDLIAQGLRADGPTDDGVGDDDPAFILYTGGTTGASKGVLHSHRSAWTGMLNQDHAERVQPDDVYLLLGQMFHIPIVLAMNYLTRGRPIVLLNFEPRATLATIEQERVSGFLGVTTMLNYLLAVDDLERYDLSSLRLVQYGGGPMGEDVVREALTRLPCDLMQGYGQTEGGPMSFLDPQVHREAAAGVGAHRLRSCGREAFLSTLRVVDENGREVPRDRLTVGEIVTRSEANMLRYWNRPEETAAALREGWIQTGDLATWDADGYLYIMDRKKEMIISGGENIYPAQVENVIYRHPSVLEVAVIGVPDETWGEAVKAVVVLKPETTATELEIIELTRRELASYMKPKSVEFMASLPKSPTGKILKRELRESFWEGRERQ
ncbi:MAG: AMP-binding protein, partial [Actinomycetota bacterium]|nr:AMP-binding protein [Actinomycetota bacterium]